MNDNPFNIVERMIEEDGKLHVHRSQDVQAILDANHEMASIAPSMHGDAAVRFVGRIPLIVAEQWATECGYAIGSPGFADHVRRKLADGDFAKLRVKGF